MATKGQIGMIRSILAKHGYTEEEKNKLILDHTGQRTKHISEMYTGEVNALKSLFQPPDPKREKMIRNLMAIAHEMKWENRDGSPDRKRVSDWCKNQGPTKQALNQIATNDLPLVLTIFKKVHESVLKDL